MGIALVDTSVVIHAKTKTSQCSTVGLLESERRDEAVFGVWPWAAGCFGEAAAASSNEVPKNHCCFFQMLGGAGRKPLSEELIIGIVFHFLQLRESICRDFN